MIFEPKQPLALIDTARVAIELIAYGSPAMSAKQPTPDQPCATAHATARTTDSPLVGVSVPMGALVAW